MKRMRKKAKQLNSRPNYPEFAWTELGTKEYWDAITDINDCYRNMLEIGKTKDTFRDAKEGVATMLTAKTQDDFKKAKTNVKKRYKTHMGAKKAILKNFRIKTELIPDPRKYYRYPGKLPPTNRETLAKEQILVFEQYLSSLNIFECSVCKECKIEEKPALVHELSYTCGTCKTKNDPEFFIRNNLHPVWYLVDDHGDYVLDGEGKKIHQYHIPEELSCLSMYEKLLIRRCANFVPTVHLRNGVCAIKGHAVTFPQSIAEMCDELPQRKETIVTFVRYLGNKDTSAVYPTTLRVNRMKVLNALVWLKKHNPFYANIHIKEENLDWMEGKEEVNLCTEGIELDIKSTPRSKKENDEEEYVSRSHATEQDEQDDHFPIQTVHANETRRVPSGRQAEPIKELIDIAKKSNDDTKFMSFPACDNTSPVK